MSKYVIGLDFGTNSCRSLLVDVANGKELATHVFPYPSGRDGVIVDAADPNLARQNPADYIKGIEATIKGVLKKAKSARKSFSTFRCYRDRNRHDREQPHAGRCIGKTSLLQPKIQEKPGSDGLALERPYELC